MSDQDAINTFLAKGGTITTLTNDAARTYAPQSGSFNPASITASKTYKKLVANGMSPREAKAVMKTDNYLASAYCNYK